MRSGKAFVPWISVAAFCVVLLAARTAGAQVDTGSVRGTVTDTTGAVVPGATVTLTNRDTSLSVTTVTTAGGEYTFSPVRIGRYTVKVEIVGFGAAENNDVVVDVQQRALANFQLKPGAVAETVEVSGIAPQLQTQDASVGLVATREQINNLPLNGRNYTFLAQLGPGVTSINPTRGLDATGSFVANGLNTVYNSYILDGIENNNNTVDFLNGAAYANLPPPDAIQQFKVQTSNFSAEFGRAGGAVVNATIKSGTNEIHGAAWEFFRHEKLDAKPLAQYFTSPKLPKGKLRRNQFGGAVGGPIVANRTFYFGDYEAFVSRREAVVRATVPTAAQVGSGFTDFRDLFPAFGGTRTDALGRVFPVATIFDPATTRRVTAGQIDPVTGLAAASSGFVRDPFYTGGSVAGIRDFTALTQLLNRLPANRLNQNALKLLQLYPAANQAGVIDNFAANRDQPDDSHHFDVRVDHNFRPEDQVFVRVSYTNRSAFFPPSITGLGENSNFGQGEFKDRSLNVAISSNHVFSPTMVNQARVGLNRLRTTSQPESANVQGVPEQFGIQGIPQGDGNGGLPGIGINGLTGLGAGAFASPNQRVSNTLQFTDDLTKVHGSHTFKGGFEFQTMHFPWIDPAWSRGQFNFGGYTGIPNGVSGGVGAADLLLTPIPATVPNGADFVGGANTVFASNITRPMDFRRYYGTYFQDDWRVTSKLTVNLGLRYEVFGQIREENGRQAALQPGDLTGKGAQYVILAKQKDAPISPEFAPLLAKNGIELTYLDTSSISTTPLTNFAPRVGAAYQVTPKLVARGAFGRFYAGFENLGGAPDPGYNYPFTVNLGFFASNDVSPLTYPNGQRATLENGLTAADPNPASPNFSPRGLSLVGFQRPWKTGYVEQWNAAVQYQLTPSQTVSAQYVGNRGRRLLNGNKRNLPTVLLPPGTNANNFIPFPDFAQNSDYVATDGSSRYHALQLNFERRFSGGLGIVANYTRSKCLSTQRNILNIGESFFFRAPTLPGFGLAPDEHACGNDVPNLFHFSGIWQLPFGKDRRFAGPAALDPLIGGWSAQWIYTLQSGFPFNIGCATRTVNSIFGCNANVVAGQSIYSRKGPHGIEQFLNPAAFATPPVATAVGQADFAPLGGSPMQVYGPTYNNLDFSVFKRFRTSDTTNVEIRGEFFNLLNHPNFSNSFKSLNYTDLINFAVINGVRGTERQVQLGLKFYW